MACHRTACVPARISQVSQIGPEQISRKIVSCEPDQRHPRWADFAKNSLPRMGSKELPRFREKSHSWASCPRNGWPKNGVQHATAVYPIPRYTRPRYIGLTLYHGSLGMDKSFHPTVYIGYNYLSMLGLKLIHVSKRGPRCWNVTTAMTCCDMI